MFVIIVIIVMFPPNNPSHLNNEEVVICHNCGWGGMIKDMKMVPGDIIRYYYCPICGEYLGYQRYSDPI